MKALSVELVPRDTSSVVFGVVPVDLGDVDRARLGQRFARIGGDRDRNVDQPPVAAARGDDDFVIARSLAPASWANAAGAKASMDNALEARMARRSGRAKKRMKMSPR